MECENCKRLQALLDDKHNAVTDDFTSTGDELVDAIRQFLKELGDKENT